MLFAYMISLLLAPSITHLIRFVLIFNEFCSLFWLQNQQESDVVLCSLVKLQGSFCHTKSGLATKKPLLLRIPMLFCGVFAEKSEIVRVWPDKFTIFVYVVELQCEAARADCCQEMGGNYRVTRFSEILLHCGKISARHCFRSVVSASSCNWTTDNFVLVASGRNLIGRSGASIGITLCGSKMGQIFTLL